MTLDKLRIGVVVKPHGVHGETKVYPTTDDLSRFSTVKKVYLLRGGEYHPMEIRGARLAGNIVICHFEGIHSPQEAEKYRNCDIYADRRDLPKLKENENYIGDLIGLEVRTEKGEFLGMVKDVFPTGANHVLVVDRTPRELLIPFIRDCILEVCLEEGFITVHLLDGLLDL